MQPASPRTHSFRCCRRNLSIVLKLEGPAKSMRHACTTRASSPDEATTECRSPTYASPNGIAKAICASRSCTSSRTTSGDCGWSLRSAQSE